MASIATTAVLAVVVNGLGAGVADFGCFYPKPIGHLKCIGISHAGSFTVASST